ncbi:MAG TPA: EAL domain-containing protein [Usitatibacter sp.]|nr:EAL domain-containing protein [Usitatibacter sp.]
MQARQDKSGEDGANAASASMARAAERLVRKAAGGALDWEGTTLASHFQPILSVRGPACEGYEALLRAVDGQGHRVAAGELFARTPESARAVLDWTCRALHLRNYARFEPDDRTLFLNVHPQAAAHDASCAMELGELVRYYGLHPKHVCVEIIAEDCDERGLSEAVAVYRALGLSIAIDDFGKARSNFDRVLALRPDMVKLDRGLVADALLGWGRARRMLAGMVELLHEVRARVVVGGIESAAEARVAIEAGADFVQGFHFSAPDAGLADEAGALSRLDAVLRSGGSGRRLAIAS